MRRRNHNKFTKKRHSKKGMLACAVAAASIFALFYLTGVSVLQKGNGGAYLGSIGILALFTAFLAFVYAVKSMREEDAFRVFPAVSLALSILAAGAWTVLYVTGFIF